jgi:hypothetical protein
MQGVALLIAQARRGLWGSMMVGCGKTLTAGLIPFVMRLRRPLLVVPGSLAGDADDEYDRLRVHWRIPTNLRIVSYQYLGHRDHARELWSYRPDGIICDEMQWLNNMLPGGATVATRFARFMHESPQTMWFGLSGSPSEELMKFGPHLNWALKQFAPVPRDLDTLQTWADVLDENVESTNRTRGNPAILEPHLGPCPSYEAASIAFGNRLFFTPGVLISTEAYVKSALEIKPVHLKFDSVIDRAMAELREEGKCPDEWLLGDSFEIYRVARELSLGFYYRHDPRPPKDWLDARRSLYMGIREVIATSDEFDSVALVFNAIINGRIPWLEDAHAHWVAIRDSFVPNTVCTWISNQPLERCLKWGKDGGIIWTHRTEFGKAIAHASGWSYFGEMGLDDAGRRIQDVKDKTIIASIQANHTGKNLQYAYNRNLATTVSSQPGVNEQWIGRTHREGQKKHTVYFDYLVGCREHYEALERAYNTAGALELKSHLPQKLRIATLIWPDRTQCEGWAYARNKSKKQ